MHDLIYRQAAIDYCYALINAENPSDPSDEWNYSQERINQTEVILHHLEFMPSAQPERLTDDDFETIRIHLSAYKERLCNQHRWEEAEEYQRIIDRFMTFASAQPECKRGCMPMYADVSDCISRQAAIDALKSQLSDWNDDYNIPVRKSIENIERLPSAQPEIIYCKDCKHLFEDNGCPLRTWRTHTEDDFCSYAERKSDD